MSYKIFAVLKASICDPLTSTSSTNYPLPPHIYHWFSLEQDCSPLSGPSPMNPLYHYQSSSFSQLLEDDHEYQTISSLTRNSTPQTNSTSSPSYLVHFHPYPQRENMNEADQNYKRDDQVSMFDDDHVFIPPSGDEIPKYEAKINDSDNIQPLIRDDGNKQCNNGSPVKWTPSKMRLMKNMMTTFGQTVTSGNVTSNDQASQPRQRSTLHDPDEPSNCSPNNKIRVCSDCNTTKTPLWRSGPRGPKSLCNACGIRLRKAKRAMAAAAASGGLVRGAYTNSNKVTNEKRSSFKDQTTQYKKRCKLSAAPRSSKNSIELFDELRMGLSKSLAFHQVLIPQDEKEAAILLIALSCGLVHGCE